MTGWQLQPDGIRTTLTSTETHVTSLNTALVNVGVNAAQSLKTGAGFDGIVLEALVGFIQEQGGSRLKPMMNRYQAAMGATATATNIYLAGDEEMAASTLGATEEAAKTGDLSRFQGGN